VLEIDDLWVSYGPVEAIRGASLRVSQGTVTAIVGANGAGKSTCLKAISGLVTPQKGSVALEGAPIHTRSPEERLRLGIAHVLEGRRLFGDQSVEDNLVLGAYPNRHRAGWKAQTLARCEEMYRRFPILGERRRQQAVTLSGGEQMMLAIAAALMAQPRLLLLDEPSLGLAPKMVEAIGDLVRELRRDGMTILLVEQMAAVALGLADFGYAFQRGRVVLSGSGTEMLRDMKFRESYFCQDDAADKQSSRTAS
jgi:branched-chain amino acid transport system ATP-binding protein